ncbi:uncharacterized protein LOC120646776 isoform X1 [Panicum virgatum]|uniref:Uncharacterized protein n=1 Tax=Panicum virgatum TaxID=38727 RepID=A0A8T0NYY3_PANVG|nr:uncharacterized protein LOC120646776 isoform X1 [Panicum virgatum]KAG2553609.1 hypothetical protein PVAP13_9KG536400 [Panicum virgatum]
MATSTSLLPPLLRAPASRHRFHPSPSASPRHLRLSPATRLLRAARRRHPDAVVVVPDARPWVGDLSGATASYRKGGEEDEDDTDADDDEEEDRSLDLLARFLHSVFRKASRRARRAARSVLPPSVPAELVKFSVNGVLVLTFLWILKGLLEKGGPSAVVETPHLWPGGPGFETTSLQHFKGILQGWSAHLEAWCLQASFWFEEYGLG